MAVPPSRHKVEYDEGVTTDSLRWAMEQGWVCETRGGHIWKDANMMMPGQQQCAICNRWRKRKVTYEVEEGQSGSVNLGDVEISSPNSDDAAKPGGHE